MTGQGSKERSTPEAVWDRMWGKFYGLPGEKNSYTVTPVSIPVRGGVSLLGDLYRPILPAGTRPAGTIYHLTPYPRHIVNSSLGMIPQLAAREYQVLDISDRGAYGSGGIFDPGRETIQDTQDVVSWMRKQDWYTGSFATIGISFNAFNQWALLEDPPPDLVTAVIIVGPHDMSRYIWGTGATNMDIIPWSAVVCHQGRGNMFRRYMRFVSTGRQVSRVWTTLPLIKAADDMFVGHAHWVHEYLTHSDLKDEYWKHMQCYNALERVNVPVLINAGWRDPFVDQAMEQYARLRERGINVGLTSGPWMHGEVGFNTHKSSFEWLEEHLAGRGVGHRDKNPVQIRLSGAGQTGEGALRHLPEWPPATTPLEYRLQPGGGLAVADPPADAAPSRFTFDPAKPTPCQPGPLLHNSVRDEYLAARADVLSFTSAPLGQDFEVIGSIAVRLAHASDNPHVDLYLRVSEVDAGGRRSTIVAEAYRRLDPARDPDAPVCLALHPCAHHFSKGRRLRLLVAGGQHPKYGRNLGTGEQPNTGVAMRSATHTVHHDAVRVSSVTLPVGVASN